MTTRPVQSTQEVLGDDPAATLMAHLPPTAVADLATRSEMMDRFDSVDQRFEKLQSGLDDVNKRIDRVLLAVVGGLFVTVAGMAGIIAAVLRTMS